MACNHVGWCVVTNMIPLEMPPLQESDIFKRYIECSYHRTCSEGQSLVEYWLDYLLVFRREKVLLTTTQLPLATAFGAPNSFLVTPTAPSPQALRSRLQGPVLKVQ